MIDDLIKEQVNEIAGLLGNKYGMDTNQATAVTSNITGALGGFFTSQLNSGKLDLNSLVDLMNTKTDNKSNALFSQLSTLVMNSLGSSGLSKDMISKISSEGLDDIISTIAKGKLGNIDMGTITQLVGAIAGKSGGLGGLLGNLGGLLGKK